jgi:hypothetical protein
MSNDDTRRREEFLQGWIAELLGREEVLSTQAEEKAVEATRIDRELAEVRHQNELATLLLAELSKDRPQGLGTPADLTRRDAEDIREAVRRTRNSLMHEHGRVPASRLFAFGRHEEIFPAERMTMADAAYKALDSIGRAAHYLQIAEEIERLELPIGAQIQPPTLLTAMKRDPRIERVESSPVRGVWGIRDWPEDRKQFDEETWEIWQRVRSLRDQMQTDRGTLNYQRRVVSLLDEVRAGLDGPADDDAALARLLEHVDGRTKARIIQAKGDRLRALIESHRAQAAETLERWETELIDMRRALLVAERELASHSRRHEAALPNTGNYRSTAKVTRSPKNRETGGER